MTLSLELILNFVSTNFPGFSGVIKHKDGIPHKLVINKMGDFNLNGMQFKNRLEFELPTENDEEFLQRVREGIQSEIDNPKYST